MATTTNYGWTTPDNTAYVKDGASAIRTLGSSVDTSLFSALDAKSAQGVLLNTTTFTAASTVNFSSLLSSSYDNYGILVNIDNVSATLDLQLRLRLNTTDESSNVYYSTGLSTIQTTTTISNWNYNGVSRFVPARVTSGGSGVVNILLGNPFKTVKTYINYEANTTYGDAQNNRGGGAHDLATSYNGFSLITSTGNMTGKARLYGYK
jgi:hypothetical protein